MKYRNLGKWGIKVSEIALGSWMIDLKDDSNLDVAKDTIRLAYENGVNFFDCADAYSGGAEEVFLGNVLKDLKRSYYVVSRKVFCQVGPGCNDGGLSVLALAWALRKPIVSSLITGATKSANKTLGFLEYAEFTYLPCSAS